MNNEFGPDKESRLQIMGKQTGCLREFGRTRVIHVCKSD